ncbi:MAG: AI-2E family transporter [Patescibacteria group bacterium]|nr:AI-2E family transporter [Patescibacteria group bacterium]
MAKSKSPLHGIIQQTHKTLQYMKGHVDRIKKSSKSAKKKHYYPASVEKRDGVDLHLSPVSAAKATLAVFGIIALGYFLIEIRSILLVFFISFLFSAALGPAVNFFERKKIPRGLGVIIVYLIILVLLGIIVSTLIPLAASQISDLASRAGDIVRALTSADGSSFLSQKLTPYLNEFYEGIDVDEIAAQLQSALQVLAKQLLTLGGNVWGAIKVISNGLFNTLLVLVITFIMTVNKRSINEFIPSLFPSKHAPYISTKLAAVQEKIGYWVRGQLMLSTIVGLIVFVGLTVIGFEYATTIALIAFFTELIPVFGPLIALMVAIPIAINQSFWMLLWVGIFFLILNWVESNVVVPLVMRSAVDISPLVILFAMLVGAQYLGIVGLILAVPVAAVLSIFVRDYLSRPKRD